MNIDHAVYWITEREAIRKRREAGEPAPWTEDPILRKLPLLQMCAGRTTRPLARL
jgi:hypothetical protein